MAWTDISTSDLAAGKPLKTTTVFSALKGNDEANAEKPLSLRVDENTTSVGTSYVGTATTFYVYVPADAKVLKIRAKLWSNTAGTTTAKGTIQLISGASGSADSSEETSTATASPSVGAAGDVTMTFSDLTNVSGDDLRGQECQLTFSVKHTSTGVTVDLETTNWPSSRYSFS